ncbi:DnaD domain protein [Limosilactobacillus ingluviei]|uniref:DnaD domain protein n=1 Tax=Limosilactobacillus ingluviei TaxID=148604 RepID=UPI0024BA9F48|nr:DnaD domain protein [Limosilactobacillus ingluviei]
MLERSPLTPKSHYVISAGANFTGLSQPTFVPYYQPLLGSAALGVLLALATELHPQPLLTAPARINQLLVQLNTGIRELTTALDRLEALRLVKTFEQASELGVVFVFELQPPLRPGELLADDLLSVLLLQQVGAARFDQLARQAQQFSLDTSSLKQVTKSFFAVFKPDETTKAQDDQALQKARQGLIQAAASAQVTAPDFDFGFFLQQAASLGVPQAALQAAQNLILAEHRLYAMDEFQLANLAARATDMATNQFNELSFKRQVQAANQPPAAPPSSTSETDDMTGLSAAMRQLVNLANQVPPVEFLRQLKEQKGGFVTPAEQRTLTELAQNSRLSNGALNVLTWYLLVDQEMPNLVANLANSIASTWQSLGVASAADALRQAQRHQQQKQARLAQRNQPKGKYTKRPRIKEQLPDWAKQAKPAASSAAVSSASVQKIEDLLADLKSDSPDKKQ